MNQVRRKSEGVMSLRTRRTRARSERVEGTVGMVIMTWAGRLQLLPCDEKALPRKPAILSDWSVARCLQMRWKHFVSSNCVHVNSLLLFAFRFFKCLALLLFLFCFSLCRKWTRSRLSWSWNWRQYPFLFTYWLEFKTSNHLCSPSSFQPLPL